MSAKQAIDFAAMGRKGGRVGGKIGGPIGGRSRSRAKLRAAKENAKLGGRPQSENPSPATLRKREQRKRDRAKFLNRSKAQKNRFEK
ncbi:MAG TPA: hypothetical protein VKX17_03380 [Planctomycetota bacterium]|nr:hypothetical protein [Planctomycetota bacterium]